MVRERSCPPTRGARTRTRPINGCGDGPSGDGPRRRPGLDPVRRLRRGGPRSPVWARESGRGLHGSGTAGVARPCRAALAFHQLPPRGGARAVGGPGRVARAAGAVSAGRPRRPPEAARQPHSARLPEDAGVRPLSASTRDDPVVIVEDARACNLIVRGMMGRSFGWPDRPGEGGRTRSSGGPLGGSGWSAGLCPDVVLGHTGGSRVCRWRPNLEVCGDHEWHTDRRR